MDDILKKAEAFCRDFDRRLPALEALLRQVAREEDEENDPRVRWGRLLKDLFQACEAHAGAGGQLNRPECDALVNAAKALAGHEREAKKRGWTPPSCEGSLDALLHYSRRQAAGDESRRALLHFGAALGRSLAKPAAR